MQVLIDMATELNIKIEYVDMRDRDGEYRHDLNRIRLRTGMTRRLERSILAHELGHAVFGDTAPAHGPVKAKQERRADEWAALRLITLDGYREAEDLHEGHAPSMAHHLGVITRLVTSYQRVIERERTRIGELT